MTIRGINELGILLSVLCACLHKACIIYVVHDNFACDSVSARCIHLGIFNYSALSTNLNLKTFPTPIPTSLKENAI